MCIRDSPYIIAEIEQLLAEHRASGEGVLVLEAPLLLELGLERMVDEVWVVAVEPAVQLQRLMDRDKLSVREAKLRIETQMPLEDKLKKADRVIDNLSLIHISSYAVLLFASMFIVGISVLCGSAVAELLLSLIHI